MAELRYLVGRDADALVGDRDLGGRIRRVSATLTLPPAGEYFTAFPTRFISSCSTRDWSPRAGTLAGASTSKTCRPSSSVASA